MGTFSYTDFGLTPARKNKTPLGNTHKYFLDIIDRNKVRAGLRTFFTEIKYPHPEDNIACMVISVTSENNITLEAFVMSEESQFSVKIKIM